MAEDLHRTFPKPVEASSLRQIDKQRLRSVLGLTALGAVLGMAIGVLFSQIDQEAIPGPSLRGSVIGLLIGLNLGLGEALLFPGLSRRVGFHLLNTARVGFYAASILTSALVVNGIDRMVFDGETLAQALSSYLSSSGPRDLVVAAVFAIAITSLFLIRRLHNPGEIRGLLSGRYYYPQSEQRIFLFADLADSTSLAESLGSLRFSSLLRECFFDISEAILAWRGQVYQYVGDGVIVSWEMADGLKDAACVRCFLDMRDLLEARKAHYQHAYGTVPRLRGGIHGGEVVTTWVGEAKKELAFHGDTLNATSRIQGLCKEFDSDLLVSEAVISAMTLPAGVRADPIGSVELRGREAALTAFAVSR